MRRGFLQFTWQWLAILAVFVSGLKLAWLTGQVDPWSWGLPALMVLAVAGAVIRWPVLWAGVGAAGTASLFCGVAAARWPDMRAVFGLIAVALLAGTGGWMLRDRRWLGGGLAVGLAASLLWVGPSRPIVTRLDRPTLAVITALPLFWGEGGAGIAAPADASMITVLRTRFDVEPIDDPLALASSGARLLLLAQPRAMPPDALVVLDQWVRDGGTALVLADPLLRWPSVLPTGDRRRAPAVHVLGPLLAHWGLVARRTVDEEVRHFEEDGALVTLSGTGVGEPLLRRRAIGRGQVFWLDDADLMDDRLWLADPARPLDPRVWSADTPALVANWLGAALPVDRRWMRETTDVLRAIRWALLFGTGWAVFGAALLHPRSSRWK